MKDIDNWRPGVLNRNQLIELAKEEHIICLNPEKIEDPSSFDLHIAEDGYIMKGCVKPQKNLDIPQIYNKFKKDKLKFENGEISLEKRKTYLFQLEESLNLKKTHIGGRATGKSTFGRLDILTRLMTNDYNSYDIVEENYSGSLWIEVTPITFPIRIRKGMSLNQLRLFKGNPSVSRIDDRELLLWGNLIFDEDGVPKEKEDERNNLTLSLKEDPTKGRNICAYAAKKEESQKEHREIDLTIELRQENLYNKEDYWDELAPTEEKPIALEIEPERFYIFRSRERFKLPKSIAIYCQAITETLGEIRIHYAGFVHPLFGANREDNKGAPLMFEVRGHNIPTFLQHGETLAKLEYYFMSQDAEESEKYADSYSNQELKLSKYFRE
ncbi:MAG TPA: 2'-deoxycytidine 5'-triphosphate deaminase [archaeon]|nr:2'-deoxycytidine 5'-triphosphate deaminase [archaeon]